MALSIDTTSESGDQAPNTTYSWSHTCAATANLLVVITTHYDGTLSDANVTGITYNGVALSKATDYTDATYRFNNEIWYLQNPGTGSSYTIQVTCNGKTEDACASAISFIGADKTDPIGASDTASGDLVSSASVTLTVDAGSYIVSGINSEANVVTTDLSVTSPAVQTHLVDTGNNGGGGSYKDVSAGGSQSIAWTIGGANEAWLMGAVEIKAESSPTVALNSPDDASSTSDTTPDLTFTGTDAEGNAIRYNVQVDTVDTFDSQSGSPLIDAVSGTDAGFVNVTGDLMTMDTYNESNVSVDGTVGDGTVNAVGQSFTADYTGNLYSVKWYVKKTGSPTGNAVAKLYTHSGTYGTSSVPTGAALSTSSNFDVSTLTTSYQLIQFTFPNGYSLVKGGNYVVTLEYTGNASNFLYMGNDDTSPSHDGNLCYNNGSWNADNTSDFVFYVLSNEPYPSGNQITYTVQSALSETTYYWRVAGLDPDGSNAYGAWSSTRSFTVSTGGGGATFEEWPIFTGNKFWGPRLAG